MSELIEKQIEDLKKEIQKLESQLKTESVGQKNLFNSVDYKNLLNEVFGVNELPDSVVEKESSEARKTHILDLLDSVKAQVKESLDKKSSVSVDDNTSEFTNTDPIAYLKNLGYNVEFESKISDKNEFENSEEPEVKDDKLNLNHLFNSLKNKIDHVVEKTPDSVKENIKSGISSAAVLAENLKNKVRVSTENSVEKLKELKEQVALKKELETMYPGLSVLEINKDYVSFTLAGFDNFEFISYDDATIGTIHFHEVDHNESSQTTIDGTHYTKHKLHIEKCATFDVNEDLFIDDIEGISIYIQENFDFKNFQEI